MAEAVCPQVLVIGEASKAPGNAVTATTDALNAANSRKQRAAVQISAAAPDCIFSAQLFFSSARRRTGAIRHASTPPMAAVMSCGQVKDAVTALSFAAGTTAGATSRTRTTYSVTNFAAAASTMLPYAAGSFFFCRYLPTSSPNRTA